MSLRIQNQNSNKRRQKKAKNLQSSKSLTPIVMMGSGATFEQPAKDYFSFSLDDGTITGTAAMQQSPIRFDGVILSQMGRPIKERLILAAEEFIPEIVILSQILGGRLIFSIGL